MITKQRLKDVRLRDEFICPITYELLREPVVACDGHTYEKNAIEKWFTAKDTSPLTSVHIEKSLVSNLALKKLIQDMINEGATGLYTTDYVARGRLVDVYSERVLVLRCLGPPEAVDWYRRSFQVTPRGCIGGRRPASSESTAASREYIIFKDVTVSRKHFEIFMASPGQYSVRDLASAGGTFIRILFGHRKELHQGMMIMLGKHQFIVSSLDDAANASSSEGLESRDSRSIASLLKEAEDLVGEISLAHETIGGRAAGDKESNSSASPFPREVESKLKNITMTLKKVEMLSRATGSYVPIPSSRAEEKSGHQNHGLFAMGRNEDHRRPREHKPDSLPQDGTQEKYDLQSLSLHAAATDDDASIDTCTTPGKSPVRRPTFPSHSGMSSAQVFEEPVSGFEHRRCVLTCCAPEGSPLIGKSFTIRSQGGSIGRDQGCCVSLSQRIPTRSPDGEEIGFECVKIDSAISSEHAFIEMDQATGKFYLSDGSKSKASTNGTWFRLSGPAQESAPYRLEPSGELLFGTLRFQISESMTINEQVVEQTPSLTTGHK